MKIEVPEFSLVLMLGASGSGKTTLANRLFGPYEVVSSDQCRAMVSNDPADQSATQQAFQLMQSIVRTRLQRGLLTVADATNLKPRDRREFLQIAKDNDCPTTAIIINLPEHICQERNARRTGRQTPFRVITRQVRDANAAVRQVRRERIHNVHVISSTQDQEAAQLDRVKGRHDLKHLEGPFDIIGDVHGCADEMLELLTKLGYVPHTDPETGLNTRRHPQARTAVFLGDLVDRGPNSPLVLDTVIAMTEAGDALCINGNHDNKLLRKLRGNNVAMTHGLPQTMEQLAEVPQDRMDQYQSFLNSLRTHYLLDQGKLAVAHAGILERYQGRSSGRVRNFCLYGETTGETDAYGLPQRVDWAEEYRGDTSVVYGHVPTTNPAWVNNTICIDTGCVFGGQLTALRYPERELVQVQAHRVHHQPERPEETKLQEAADNPASPDRTYISIEDLTGQRSIWTQATGRVRIDPDHASAAMETLSRFALDPRWLPYIPPTISPCETSHLEDILEHPDQALAHYASQKIPQVICEEKHMGSRATIIVGTSPEAVSRKFRVNAALPGHCYTRTGRPFFNDAQTLEQFLDLIRQGVQDAGLFEQLQTDWLIMDAEIMPWSLKAQELINRQYAPIGVTGANTLRHTTRLLELARARGVDTAQREAETSRRAQALDRYRKAYSHYCWETPSITDIKAAPFHILASEGSVHADKPHAWHMDLASRLAQANPSIFQATRNIAVDPASSKGLQQAHDFWAGLTAAGGEGIVVKPMDFVPPRGTQPAVKCRGPEYLRIIYGPEYNLPQNLPHLKHRRTQAKRSMATRQFHLGLEALNRFAAHEPPHRYHQCVFAIIALDAEPVDPRL